ncbi:hypothetical protein MHF_1167 [Mycoplasma haemofelis Ohio2]|uniref:Uncharacterized protein n=1 Tax=Mycoplasma haemofelis (strain Ohio2) TaxID=859194 RepID=F6FJQ3_MYCHI|nr:hypothetical protein MHF_1167 [Mycoplasma haemofelis Ohio2]
MAYSLLKAATLGGTAAAAGGGIAAGASMFPSAGQKAVKYEKTSSPIRDEAKVPELPPAKPICTIYEIEAPTGQKGSRTFNRLLKKFKDQETFFEEFGSRVPSLGIEKTKEEINGACESENKNINGNIYVWYGSVSSGQTWIYASDLNGTTDWVNEDRITKDFPV